MNDELFNEKIAVLNHDAGCSVFYSGGCTCDLQARRAKVEVKIEKHNAAVDRETALVMFRSTLALHGTPSSAAARVAIMFAARMAAEAGMPATEFRDLATDEYALAKDAKKADDRALRQTIDAAVEKVDAMKEKP